MFVADLSLIINTLAHVKLISNPIKIDYLQLVSIRLFDEEVLYHISVNYSMISLSRRTLLHVKVFAEVNKSLETNYTLFNHKRNKHHCEFCTEVARKIHL